MRPKRNSGLLDDVWKTAVIKYQQYNDALIKKLMRVLTPLKNKHH